MSNHARIQHFHYKQTDDEEEMINETKYIYTIILWRYLYNPRNWYQINEINNWLLCHVQH